jgi:type II secretory pathway pseudopilin PulG
VIRRRHSAAFTLLEAMIALIVLAAVAGACLQLRSQTLRQRVAVARAIQSGEALTELLTMARAGLLPEPEGPLEGDERMLVTWRGELRGHAYEVTRELVTTTNPALQAQGLLLDAATVLPQELVMLRYRAVYAGVSAQELILQ